MLAVNLNANDVTIVTNPVASTGTYPSHLLTYDKDKCDICATNIFQKLFSAENNTLEFTYAIEGFSIYQVKRTVTRLVKQNFVKLQLKNTDPDNYRQRSTFLTLNLPQIEIAAQETRDLRWACDQYTEDHHKIVCRWARRVDICYKTAKIIVERIISKGYKPVFANMRKFLAYMAKVLRFEKNTADYLESIVKRPLSQLRSFWKKLLTQGIYNKITMFYNSKEGIEREKKENNTKEKKERLSDQEMLDRILGKRKGPIDIIGHMTVKLCQNACFFAKRYNKEFKPDFTSMGVRGMMIGMIQKEKDAGNPLVFYSAVALEKYVTQILKKEKRPNWALEKSNKEEYQKRCDFIEEQERKHKGRGYYREENDYSCTLPQKAQSFVYKEGYFQPTRTSTADPTPEEVSANCKGMLDSSIHVDGVLKNILSNIIFK